MARTKVDKQLRVEQVADMFQVSKYTVRDWLKAGKLQGFKTPGGQQWRVFESEANRLAQEMYGDNSE